MFHATGVRRIAGAAAGLLVGLLAMGGFFYWETVGYLTRQIDGALQADVRSFANEDRPALLARLSRSLQTDLGEGKAYAIFTPAGTRVTGNIPSIPSASGTIDGPVSLKLRIDSPGPPHDEAVRLVTERLGNGDLLFMGRSTRSLNEVREIVSHAMLLAVLPALSLSLIGGVIVSRSTSRRIQAVRQACQSIMLGAFDLRLPVNRRQDDFDRLSVIVNTMLDEIERLVAEVKGAGDAVAHDLRTPLTRLHARLERTLNSVTEPHAKAVLQKALGDVDQLLTTVQALMRIAEVEQSRRRVNFAPVDLAEVVTMLVEFYQPIAEEKGLTFQCSLLPDVRIDADGDLLFEALANLASNAIKFTPEGGVVGLEIAAEPDGTQIAVWDTGSGIPPEERENVLRRFYRLDRSRHSAGSGLGLSLVAAVARMHQFPLRLLDRQGGGLRVELTCSRPSGL